jgi:hypothetical protein
MSITICDNAISSNQYVIPNQYTMATGYSYRAKSYIITNRQEGAMKNFDD